MLFKLHLIFILSPLPLPQPLLFSLWPPLLCYSVFKPDPFPLLGDLTFEISTKSLISTGDEECKSVEMCVCEQES